MNQHLYERVQRTVEARREKGFDTNERAVRLFIEYAEKPEWWRLLDRNYFANTPREECYGPSFWLSPSGLVWTVQHGSHSDFSEAAGLSYAHMQDAGWVHVSDGRIDQFYPFTPRQDRVVATLMSNSRYRVENQSQYRREGILTPRPPLLGAKTHHYPPQKVDEAYLARMRGLSKPPLEDYHWDDPRWWKEATPEIAQPVLNEADLLVQRELMPSLLRAYGG